MRVEGFQKVAQVYTGKNNVKAAADTQKNGKDQLEISQSGKDYQIAKQAVADIDDVRGDVVERLREKMQSGSYEVSGDEFAARVIEKYNQLML